MVNRFITGSLKLNGFITGSLYFVQVTTDDDAVLEFLLSMVDDLNEPLSAFVLWK